MRFLSFKFLLLLFCTAVLAVMLLYYFTNINIPGKQPILNVIHNVKDMASIEKENKILKSKLQEQESLSVQKVELEKENKNLQAVVDKTKEVKQYDPLQASVMYRNSDPSSWYETVVIDKGSQDQVQNNMAVITKDGLIGKITNVKPTYSEVKLLSSKDKRYRISASIKGKKNINGILNGYDPSNKYLMVRDILNKNIKKGEKVVTSGLGEILPPNLDIGTIVKVKPDPYGLTSIAYIKPSADFYDINQVVILRSSANQ
ncbi:rod shape-determining protein MreC [Fictibacillus sp. KIGAM418]|uniref:Cell shape-determining protein MreC n=1 Tax=Fictibacillus marinisediminis TaxID=2878389 RepID=A0A9X2BD33_9BACL|nr:rod shape-determining protein MreC [Fictibacillus marinisediminis]MCK6256255.1 rod shape-determining protein MreC [Fictibacillus marinisediminis]